MCCVFLGQPSNLVNLLLDFKAFKVVKLRLVTLEGAVNIVLSTTLWLVLALKRETQTLSISTSSMSSNKTMLDPCVNKHKPFL